MSRVGGNRFLLSASVKPATLRQYNASVVGFINWCRENGEDARAASDLDELVCDYMHYLFINGGGYQAAANLISGISLHLPSLRSSLSISRRALKGWQRLRTPSPWPPLTYPLCVAIACQLSSAGFVREAIGCLLAFECYLRIGEFTSLMREDVAFAGDARLGAAYAGSALRLRATKTGTNQWVSVRDAEVIILLRALVNATPVGKPLFPFHPSHFRRVFKAACLQLGLDHIGYVPHSLRHGGATRDYLGGMPLEDVMFRGRWASTKSARHYIQSGRALLLSLHIPPYIHQRGIALSHSPALFLLLSAPKP